MKKPKKSADISEQLIVLQTVANLVFLGVTLEEILAALKPLAVKAYEKKTGKKVDASS